MFDKFDVLAMEAEAGGIAVSVLGNADVTDIELLPIAPRGYGADKINALAREWAPRQLRFIGTIGMVDGKPRVALTEPLDERRIAALAEAFAAYCGALLAGKIEDLRKGDSVEWLRRLHSLPDTRTVH